MAMPTVVGVGARASGVGDITPAYPVGYTAVADDIGVTFIETSTEQVPAPTGWTAITEAVVSSGTTTRLRAYWRRIQAGDTAPTYSISTDHKCGGMIVIRGCANTGDPWNQFTQATELAADTSVSVPGVTTTVANCLVIAAFGCGTDANSTTALTWSNASLASVTHRYSGWSNAGNGGGLAFCTGQKAVAGATGSTTTTQAVTANFKTLITIALKEQSGTTWTITTTLAGSGTLTAGAVREAPAAATLTGTGTLAADATAAGGATWNIDTTLTGTGTLTAGVIQVQAAATTLTGSGTLTAAVIAAQFTAATTLAGSGTLSAGITQTKPIAATSLTGTGTLAAAVVAVRPTAAATLSGTGTLAADAVVGAAPKEIQATLTGSGTLSAGAIRERLATTTLAGTGTLLAAIVLQAVAAATLTGSGTLTAAPTLTAGTATTLGGAGVLAADITAQGAYDPAYVGVDNSTTSSILDHHSRQPAELAGATTSTHVDL